jgi:small subunit ribosomal protein S17
METKSKALTGVVISNSGKKSRRIAVDFVVKHPKYGKYLRRQSRLAVHDELDQSGVGDLVEVVECRPYSKTKSWRVVRVLQKARES